MHCACPTPDVQLLAVSGDSQIHIQTFSYLTACNPLKIKVIPPEQPSYRTCVAGAGLLLARFGNQATLVQSEKPQ